MIQRTNINLTDNQGHTFMYCVEFDQGNQLSTITGLPVNDSAKYSGPEYVHYAGAVHFKDSSNPYTPLLHYGNDWTINDKRGEIDALPRGIGYKYHTARVYLYFPQFAVDTYEKGTKYAFTISTYIHGKRVYLASYIVDRLNAVAAPKVMHFAETNYYEVIPFTIIDPRDMMWSDDWAAWRHSTCGEPFIPSIGNHKEDISTWNADGSNLYFSLYAIEEIDGTWVKMNGYDGGQNCMTISQTLNDFFHLDISLDEADGNLPTHVCGTIRCNYEYASVVKDENIPHNYKGYGLKYDLPLYFYETYGKELGKITVNLVVQDDNDIFKSVSITKNADEDMIFIFDREDLSFDGWSGYKEGVRITGSMTLYEKDGGEVLYTLSNDISLTPEKFALLVKGDLWEVPYVNVVDKDEDGNLLYVEEMKVYNISTVNKVQQTVVQMDRPDNSKSNIIMPVFFKARDVQNVVIHPAVTEVLALNLDAYKSKVSTFIMQVEGQPFVEIGRSDAGVLFRVVGNMLPNAVQEGTYYILNEDGDMVTSGHYTYEV